VQYCSSSNCLGWVGLGWGGTTSYKLKFFVVKCIERKYMPNSTFSLKSLTILHRSLTDTTVLYCTVRYCAVLYCSATNIYPQNTNTKKTIDYTYCTGLLANTILDDKSNRYNTELYGIYYGE
jgi:Pyruvate/2-oxoacid:ferredoxin oxidoreductase delta subunit